MRSAQKIRVQHKNKRSAQKLVLSAKMSSTQKYALSAKKRTQRKNARSAQIHELSARVRAE